MSKLIDKIIENKVKTLSVIGLAKNTGKTVTFNTIIKECIKKGIRPSLISFGRDGEAIDAITLLEKPRIIVPPNTYFVTAEKFINPSVIKITNEISTGIFTVFGETRIYRTGLQGGMVELIGINTLKNLSAVLPILKELSDITLVDGALDRKSSAVPSHSDASIIATGAVLGMTENDVIRKTNEVIKRFKIPLVQDSKTANTAKKIFKKGFAGCETLNGRIITFENNNEAIIEAQKNLDVITIYLSGAITNYRFELLSKINNPKLKIIIKDGTRVFLDNKNLNAVSSKKDFLRVLHSINIIAITVNPTRPFFTDMDSDFLIENIEKNHPEYFCCNVKSKKYS